MLHLFETFIRSLHNTCLLDRGQSLWFSYKTKATWLSCFCFGMSSKPQLFTLWRFIWNRNWSINSLSRNTPLWRYGLYMLLLFSVQLLPLIMKFSKTCLIYISQYLAPLRQQYKYFVGLCNGIATVVVAAYTCILLQYQDSQCNCNWNLNLSPWQYHYLNHV